MPYLTRYVAAIALCAAGCTARSDSGADDGSHAESGGENSPTDEGGGPGSGPTSTGSTSATAGGDHCEDGISPDPDPDTGPGDSSGFGSSDDGVGGMDDDMPIVTLTADIRQNVEPLYTRVLVEDLVVTARPSRSEYIVGQPHWDVFVQDQAGGPWSGLRLQTDAATASELSPGDTVDVIGIIDEIDGIYFVNVRASAGDMVATIGEAEPPEPPVLPIEQLTLDNNDAYQYEAMPIRIEQVVVTDDDACEGEFMVDDTVRIDDRFSPGELPPPSQGTMLTALGGVLIYTFDAFELAPRDASELPGG